VLLNDRFYVFLGSHFIGVPWVAMSSDLFARVVVFAMGQPGDAGLNEILFRPSRQAR
jgi:hypothetical protein